MLVSSCSSTALAWAARAGRGAVIAALVLGASASLPPSARADDARPLSLTQAIELAQNRSQTLVAQQAAASAARQMALAAGQVPDPVLTVGVNNLPVNGADAWSLTSDFMTMRSIGVMQEFTRQDKRTARAARYDREADLAEAGSVAALAGIQSATALAWLDVHFNLRIGAFLLAERDETSLQIAAADSAYRAARGSQAEVFAARSAVAQIEDRIAQNEAQVAVARAQLARWIGPAAARPLGAAPGAESIRLDLQQLESQLARHPQIMAMARQEALSQAEADVARANKQADWSAALMYSQRGPDYSNMISVNFSFPLQWDQKDRQDRELAAKLALVEQARAQSEESLRERVAEVRAMLLEWQSRRQRLARYDSTLIPLATERARAALAAYRAGGAALGAVLEARRSAIETGVERLRLEQETARLWAQLNFLIPNGDGAARPGR